MFLVFNLNIVNIKDLKIYNSAIELEKELYKAISDIPYAWDVEQIKQIRRSSSSISANIIEGWNRRFYIKDFLRFLYIAMGSSDETQHHLRILNLKEKINETICNKLLNNYKSLSIKILNFINYLRKKYNINNVI